MLSDENLQFKTWDNEPTACIQRMRSEVVDRPGGKRLEHRYPNGTSGPCFGAECGQKCLSCGIAYALGKGHWVKGEVYFTEKHKAETAEQERDQLRRERDEAKKDSERLRGLLSLAEFVPYPEPFMLTFVYPSERSKLLDGDSKLGQRLAWIDQILENAALTASKGKEGNASD